MRIATQLELSDLLRGIGYRHPEHPPVEAITVEGDDLCDTRDRIRALEVRIVALERACRLILEEISREG